MYLSFTGDKFILLYPQSKIYPYLHFQRSDLQAASIFSAGARPLSAAHPFGAGGAIFSPVGLWRKRGPALTAAFHFVPVFGDLRIQGRVQREDSDLKPPAQQRIGNALYADTFLAVVQQ